jgi:hypothetical protein
LGHYWDSISKKSNGGLKTDLGGQFSKYIFSYLQKKIALSVYGEHASWQKKKEN